MRHILAAVIATALVGGCTWVKLDDAAQTVRVAYDGNVAGCRQVGDVGVSVKDKVGFYQRNDLKVRDELESLARNEAATMHADTIKAIDEPHDGEQNFAAYACGSHRAPTATTRPYKEEEKKSGDVETYPIKDH
jgi:hypothetical protein